jgi:hypothetical protein
MGQVFLLALSLFFFARSITANDSITTMSDYSQHAMTELAASPPLLLLENKKGKVRHEIILGHISTDVDDNANLSDGTITKEKGEASGFGVGYGYNSSFKEKWSWFFWLQAAQQSGDHTQTTESITTIKISDMETLNASLSFGLSYEFLRESDKHTLNVFAGPSFLLLDVSGAIQTYNTSGSITSAYDGSFDGVLPAITLGSMYEYKFFENFQIVPYAMVVLSLADECQTFRVDNVSLNDGSATTNSPECGSGTGTVDGETDISPSFATIGVKFNYRPWDLGFNVSGIIRDAILRSDNEERAQVKGALLSLSKSWGD